MSKCSMSTHYILTKIAFIFELNRLIRLLNLRMYSCLAVSLEIVNGFQPTWREYTIYHSDERKRFHKFGRKVFPKSENSLDKFWMLTKPKWIYWIIKHLQVKAIVKFLVILLRF